MTEQTTNNNFEQSWEPEIAKQIQMAVDGRRRPEDANSNTNSNRTQPYMVAIVGIPGGGKSVSSFLVTHLLEEQGIESMIMPHDGYHYPLEHLKMFPNPHDVIYRRGAPDTFDPQALQRDLERIRTGDEEVIKVPGFDHSKGDPEPDAHMFDRTRHQVVLCEGLYLFHNGDGWDEIASQFDLKIYIESDVDNCVERLKVRNLCIPGYTPAEIQVRCETVDRVNAMTVLRSKCRANTVVESIVSKPKPSAHPLLHSRDRLSTDALNLMSTNANTTTPSHERSSSSSGQLLPPRHSYFLSEYHQPHSDDAANNTTNNNTSEPHSAAAGFTGTWESEMAERIHSEIMMSSSRRHNDADDRRHPYMVALVGTPGSGKSISSLLLANTLEESGVPCMVMPHDGYHYTLDYLKTFPDADDAIYRRGAPDTFDPHALKRDLDRIREGEEDFLTLPAFDHAKGDPEPDRHAFDRQRHKVVICEGLYLLHDQDGWEDVASVFDLKIFMDSDLDVCMDRVKIRNQCIPGYTLEEMAERVDRVDRVNALTVLKSKARADVVVDSLAMRK